MKIKDSMSLKVKYFLGIFSIIFLISACKTNKQLASLPTKEKAELNLTSGSSGMEQIGDQSFLLVYDLKGFQKGTRVALLNVSDKGLKVLPIKIDSWGKGGISSDLESVCKIPNKPSEFLMAESGNWQGKGGRIFHVKLDIANLSAKVLGSIDIPQLNRNDRGIVGDQYEAIICLPKENDKALILLGERGGSKHYPHGTVRWGSIDFSNYSFKMIGDGLKGIEVSIPNDWKKRKSKRDITDFHVDASGGVWASASQDFGDSGPFYSVIYKLGQINDPNHKKPITVFDEIIIAKNVNGFKIEALSSGASDINTSHSFGSEDEMYGGVWRPIDLDSK